VARVSDGVLALVSFGQLRRRSEVIFEQTKGGVSEVVLGHTKKGEWISFGANQEG